MFYVVKLAMMIVCRELTRDSMWRKNWENSIAFAIQQNCKTVSEDEAHNSANAFIHNLIDY